MNNLQALIAEWREIAEAQRDSANEPGGTIGECIAYSQAASIYDRCADDLEKALKDQPPGARGEG